MISKIQVAWMRIVKMVRVRKVGFLLLGIAALIGLVGYLNQYMGLFYCLGECFGNLCQDFYANVSTELASIAITVLVIDMMYQQHDVEREKRDLILQMGSPDNAFAREAVRKLRAHGWLKDGTLRRANLFGANLSGANLFQATLHGAKLMKANLSGANLTLAILIGAYLNRAELIKTNLHEANLSGANLSEADLSEADLTKTDLRWANLSGANLSGANLFQAQVTHEQLVKTKTLEGAIMPDGTKKPEKGEVCTGKE